MVVVLLLLGVMMLLLLLLLMVMVTACAGTAGIVAVAAAVLFLLYPLLQVDLGVAFLLVGSGKLAAADVAGEGFLAGVGADVGGEVVRAAEGSHADPALEGFLAGVDPDMSGEFVRSRESSVAVFDGAGVRSLVNGRFAGPVRVLAGLHWDKLQWHGALLVHLVQDLVTLAGRRVVLGQLNRVLGLLLRGQLTQLAGIRTLGGAVRFLLGDDARRGGGRRSGNDYAVLRTSILNGRVQPLIFRCLSHSQPLTARVLVHLLSLLLLLHVQRRYTAGIARWLFQNDTRAVHVQAQKLNRLVGAIIVVMRRMPMMTRRRWSLSRTGRRLLRRGKVSLSGTLRSRTEQTKHRWLE